MNMEDIQTKVSKKHIITIAGKLGSGKSSTAKLIASKLGYKHFSSGDFMRNMAQERNLSLEELSALAEKDDSIDRAIDAANAKVGQGDNLVIDSRLGFHFIPASFKVYLELKSEISAKRALADAAKNPNRHKEIMGGMQSIDDAARAIQGRFQSENKRYHSIYGIDQTDQNQFNLVIDTESIPVEGVADKILEEYQKWLVKTID